MCYLLNKPRLISVKIYKSNANTSNGIINSNINLSFWYLLYNFSLNMSLQVEICEILNQQSQLQIFRTIVENKAD